jgi:hypothetical protein
VAAFGGVEKFQNGSRCHGNQDDMVQHVLLPVNIHFHWNLFIFEFLTIYFDFLLAAILKILKTKNTTLSDDLLCVHIILRLRNFRMAAVATRKREKFKVLGIWGNLIEMLYGMCINGFDAWKFQNACHCYNKLVSKARKKWLQLSAIIYNTSNGDVRRLYY